MTVNEEMNEKIIKAITVQIGKEQPKVTYEDLKQTADYIANLRYLRNFLAGIDAAMKFALCDDVVEDLRRRGMEIAGEKKSGDELGKLENFLDGLDAALREALTGDLVEEFEEIALRYADWREARA